MFVFMNILIFNVFINMSEKVIRETKCFCIRIHRAIKSVIKTDCLRSWFVFFSSLALPKIVQGKRLSIGL